MSRTLENGRATFAYKIVSEVNKKDYKSDYRSLVRSFPIMILTNGYGSAMAFLYSKRDKESEHRELYMNISDWLKLQEFVEKAQVLMYAITEQERDGYKY